MSDSGYDPAKIDELHNGWGTLRSDIDTDDGYCPECERENYRHYDCCPLHRNNWKELA